MRSAVVLLVLVVLGGCSSSTDTTIAASSTSVPPETTTEAPQQRRPRCNNDDHGCNDDDHGCNDNDHGCDNHDHRGSDNHHNSGDYHNVGRTVRGWRSRRSLRWLLCPEAAVQQGPVVRQGRDRCRMALGSATWWPSRRRPSTSIWPASSTAPSPTPREPRTEKRSTTTTTCAMSIRRSGRSPVPATATVYEVDAGSVGFLTVPFSGWPVDPSASIPCPSTSCNVWVFVNGGEVTEILEQFTP